MDEYIEYLARKYPSLSHLQPKDMATIAAVIRAESLVSERKTEECLGLGSLCPFDFLGLDSGTDGFMAAHFNWRWIYRPSDQMSYRVLTVEFSEYRKIASFGPPRITPCDLAAKCPDFYDELFNCMFNWRWYRNGEIQFRTVTLETVESFNENSPPGFHLLSPRFPLPGAYSAGYVMDEYVPYLKQKYPSLSCISGRQLETVAAVIHAETQRSPAPTSLCPFDFLGLDNGGDGFMAAYFNWRWFRRDSDGVNYRLVTVEFGERQEVLSLGPPRIIPRDLAANAPDYHDELFNCTFNWRRFNREGTVFKVVTIETVAGVVGLSYPIGNFVEPLHLMGLPEDTQDWDNLKFYWRWFQRSDDNFRVLTLE